MYYREGNKKQWVLIVLLECIVLQHDAVKKISPKKELIISEGINIRGIYVDYVSLVT